MICTSSVSATLLVTGEKAGSGTGRGSSSASCETESGSAGERCMWIPVRPFGRDDGWEWIAILVLDRIDCSWGGWGWSRAPPHQLCVLPSKKSMAAGLVRVVGSQHIILSFVIVAGKAPQYVSILFFKNLQKCVSCGVPNTCCGSHRRIPGTDVEEAPSVLRHSVESQRNVNTVALCFTFFFLLQW